MPYEFGPAAEGERIAYGACRPGHDLAPPGTGVEEWLSFVRERRIERVVCLLDDELAEYDGLIARYREAFGPDAVLHAPIADFATVERRTFDSILTFLRESDRDGRRTVVHCSAGWGRTGHVLVGWLACERGYGLREAVGAVQTAGRRPLEGGKTLSDLRGSFGR